MRRKQILYFSTILAVLTFGCTLFSPSSPTASPSPTAVPTSSAPPTTAPAPATAVAVASATAVAPQPAITLEMLKNFTYSLEYTPDHLIPLKDGAFEGPNTPSLHVTSQLVEPAAFGDLNGDGVDDAAVNLATNTGGTGTFINLVAVLSTSTGPAQAASIYIDDRASVKALKIEGGQIIMDVLHHGPSDPMCCPATRVIQTYQLSGNTLALVSEQPVP